MKISDFKVNKSNPRTIKNQKFEKLIQSIIEFPEMMAKRQIVSVTDEDGKHFPLGGNMRYSAIKEIKSKGRDYVVDCLSKVNKLEKLSLLEPILKGEIPDSWVNLVNDWTDEQRKEFTIKDNVSFGEWDWDDIANEWDSDELEAWGMDLPGFDSEVQDYSEKNKEIDVDDFSDKMEMKFEFSSEEYQFIQGALSRIDGSKEIAILKLLNYES